MRQLHKLLVSLEAMGADEPAATIVRAGLDSIPAPRRDVLIHLLRRGEQSTSDIAVAQHLPALSVTRASEDLVAHRLLSRRKAGDAANSPNLWEPAELASVYWRALGAYTEETSAEDPAQ